MSTNSFAYKCKVCGTGRTVQATADFADPFIQRMIDTFVPKLCCDRCGDYMEARNKTWRWCRHLAGQIQTLQLNNRWSEDAREAIRERLVRATRRFAEVVCKYHGHVTLWEPDFADIILNQPERANKHLSFYVERIRIACRLTLPE